MPALAKICIIQNLCSPVSVNSEHLSYPPHFSIRHTAKSEINNLIRLIVNIDRLRILASAHPAAQQVAESESRIAALKVQKRELLEAINAGKTALHTVNEVLETLDNAEGWSTWDVMGGGLMADLAKYEELDNAQEQVEQLQVELRRFKTELADVEITADLQVAVDSFLKFADFFFDGLFADWAVLDHINQAQSRVENTKSQIKRVLALLKKMREDVDVQIADEKEKQEQLAVETEL